MHFTAVTQNADLGYRSTYETRYMKDKMLLVRDKDRQTTWHLAAEIGHLRPNVGRRQFIDTSFPARCRLFMLLHYVGLVYVCGTVQ